MEFETITKKKTDKKYWIAAVVIMLAVLTVPLLSGQDTQVSEPTTAPTAAPQPTTTRTVPTTTSPSQEITGKVSADGVDIIPDISISECLSEIRRANPEISEQAAKDNCYTIEAVNKGDSGLCNQVSESFRQNCLDQF